jgi:hypothetical protein
MVFTPTVVLKLRVYLTNLLFTMQKRTPSGPALALFGQAVGIPAERNSIKLPGMLE